MRCTIHHHKEKLSLLSQKLINLTMKREFLALNKCDYFFLLIT